MQKFVQFLFISLLILYGICVVDGKIKEDKFVKLDEVELAQRREAIKKEFLHSWNGYVKYPRINVII
jgi:hypothetical protein